MQLIIGNYRITSDERCYVVEERKVTGDRAKNPGVEKWANARFPSTLLQACTMVLQANISKSEACELGQVIATIERAQREIVQAVGAMER